MAFLLKMPTFWRSRRLQVYILRLEMMMFIAIPPHTRREISKEIESPVFHSFPPNVSKRGYHSTISTGASLTSGMDRPHPMASPSQSRATSAAELVLAKRFVSARNCRTSASISGSRPLRT